MNFADMDAAPELLLNRIICKSVYGADNDMPSSHANRVCIERGTDENLAISNASQAIS